MDRCRSICKYVYTYIIMQRNIYILMYMCVCLYPCMYMVCKYVFIFFLIITITIIIKTALRLGKKVKSIDTGTINFTLYKYQTFKTVDFKVTDYDITVFYVIDISLADIFPYASTGNSSKQKTYFRIYKLVGK